MKIETIKNICNRMRYLSVKIDDHLTMVSINAEVYGDQREKSARCQDELDFLESIIKSEGINLGTFYRYDEDIKNDR